MLNGGGPRVRVIWRKGALVRKFLIAFFAALSAQFLFLQPLSAQVARPVVTTATGPAYRINAGDEIEVMVWGDDRLQRVVRVLPDGTFSFPLVGQVVAAGQLPSDLERIISAALRPQYRGAVPQVTVSVKNPSGYQFSVVGKVRSPGTYTPGRYVNALEAISIAGGPTEFAQTGDITILRKAGRGMQTLHPRLSGALKGNVPRSPQ